MDTIRDLSLWLSQFPYENVSKRLNGFPRTPGKMIQDRDELGTGGTCFSLVNLAYEKASEIGLDPAYYLGDRPKGEDRHCVIGFPRSNVFIDPGYLFFEPLPLNPDDSVSIVNPHNVLHLEPKTDHRLKVQTERKNQKTWRYTLKNQPVSRDRFERAWKSSFDWEGVMNSTVITRLTGDGMYCFLNGSLEIVDREKRRNIKLPKDENRYRYLKQIFDLDPDLLRTFEKEHYTGNNS